MENVKDYSVLIFIWMPALFGAFCVLRLAIIVARGWLANRKEYNRLQKILLKGETVNQVLRNGRE